MALTFIDEARLEVRGGDGGDGSVAFRREKFVPLGGPAGGDGGKGGDVILVVDPGLTTLLDFRYRRRIEAENGEHGRGKDQYGKGGRDQVLRVPLGTQVYDDESGELLADLDQGGTRFVVAKGGRGGRGNLHFVTPYDRAPHRAEKGTPGEKRKIRFELKLLADVGLLGFPNVGKSTLIASVSRARPKIADYPFTTLTPNLGVVSVGEERSFVIADIPGIVEGASEGVGLGLRFLRHIERTRVLLHIVTLDPDPEREPEKDFERLMTELERFDPDLARRPMIVALSKIDLPEVRERMPEILAQLGRSGRPVTAFSAATGEGVRELMIQLSQLLDEHPLEAENASP